MGGRAQESFACSLAPRTGWGPASAAQGLGTAVLNNMLPNRHVYFPPSLIKCLKKLINGYFN